MPDEQLPIISLFCGAGGLDLGFRRQGFQIVLACDHFQAAIDSYNLNTNKKVAKVADLATINNLGLDRLLRDSAPGVCPQGVIGGPPCQGFSRGNARADSNDPRNLLPFKYAELLAGLNRRYQLKFFVFENVMGLMNPRHSLRFNSILRAFKKAGFNIFRQALNANAFGVPQNRPRLFIVGLNKMLFPDVEFIFPKGRAKPKKIKDVIAGMPVPVYFRRGICSADISYHVNHWTMTPKSSKLTTESPTDGRSFRRLHWGEQSPTVAYGNREIHVHPDGGRRLSVHEAMLLQGFPSHYRLAGNFSEQITQVSNAVPPPVANALARRIRKRILTKVWE